MTWKEVFDATAWPYGSSQLSAIKLFQDTRSKLTRLQDPVDEEILAEALQVLLELKEGKEKK